MKGLQLRKTKVSGVYDIYLNRAKVGEYDANKGRAVIPAKRNVLFIVHEAIGNIVSRRFGKGAKSRMALET